MNLDPQTARDSRKRLSKDRTGVIIGATALALIAAGAAAGCAQDTTASDPAATSVAPSPTEQVPSTTAPRTREHQSSTTAAPRKREHQSSTTAAPRKRERQTSSTSTVPPTTSPPPRKHPAAYTVIEVVDGDTITVTPSGQSRSLRVRLIGIDAPESGSCEADAATWALASMVQSQRVILRRGGDGENADRYGRYLRYVDVHGVDAGLRLIEDGLAIARYDSRDGYGAHRREASYVAADDASPAYSCPPPTTQPPPITQAPPPPAPPPTAPPPPDNNGCDPNYTGCVPIDTDVDCAGGSGNGPSYVDGPVQVIGSDIYDLDGDGDGWACE